MSQVLNQKPFDPVFDTPLPDIDAMIKEGRMKGTRKHIDDAGELFLAEGEYGKDRRGIWYARPFGMHMGGLENHDVTEHDDGSITVHPSILITYATKGNGEIRWHGYLERGVWREVD